VSTNKQKCYLAMGHAAHVAHDPSRPGPLSIPLHSFFNKPESMSGFVSESDAEAVAEDRGEAGGVRRRRCPAGRQINESGDDGKCVEDRILVCRGGGGCRRLGDRWWTVGAMRPGRRLSPGRGWSHRWRRGNEDDRRDRTITLSCDRSPDMRPVNKIGSACLAKEVT
jgi:hypothetical protein